MSKITEDMRNESLKEGMELGKKEGIKATALRMLKTGEFTLEKIAEISGLPLEEVKKLSEDKNA